MEIGLTHTSSMLVTHDKLAEAVGSGDLGVLATPAMLALMENAAMMAVAGSLPEGCTTVGGQISSSHLMPTPPGASVTATARLTAVEGRKLSFDIEAHDGEGRLLGSGSHVRFIVGRQRFDPRGLLNTANFRVALAAVSGQQPYGVLVQRLGLLVAP